MISKENEGILRALLRQYESGNVADVVSGTCNLLLREVHRQVFGIDFEDAMSAGLRYCQDCGQPVPFDHKYAVCASCGVLSKCRHGCEPDMCDACDFEADLDYDARREAFCTRHPF